MAKDISELIDSRVSVRQCKRAVQALHTHENKKAEEQHENDLLGPKEQAVWLVVAVKKMYPERKLKPFRIPVQHPLVDPRTTSVCLICKDPQREYKDLLESHGIKFISRVVGIAKLKGKFKPFEARRLLLKEHGLFLADERVIPLLPTLLGKKWFEAKKQPIPVCLTRKDLKSELERAINSTYMHQNRGTCTSVKIGTLSHTPAQILANIKTALPAVAQTIKGGWENIQSFYIKTPSSVSLPIWLCNLDDTDGGRWNGLTKSGDDGDDESSGNNSESDGSAGPASDSDEDDEPVVTVPRGLGKSKRAPEPNEPPNKKAKTTPVIAPTPPKPSGKHQPVTKQDPPAISAVKPKADPPGKKTPRPLPGSTSTQTLGQTTSVIKHTKPTPVAVHKPEETLAPIVKKVQLDVKKRMGLVEQKKMKLLNRKLGTGRSAKNAVIGRRLGK